MAAAAGRSAVRLAVEDLRFGFPGGDDVLDGFTVEVPAGSVLSLLGPSGCGKTTLLRLAAGLEAPAAGTVTVGEQILSGPGLLVAPEKRGIGMVFQDWALFPHLDVAANVAFGLPRALRRDPAAIAPTLELVGLEGMGARMPAQLSGGQQQRVALGRALAQQPDVLLLDEPFSNLDPSLRARVRSDVHELLREIGVTTVMVTHDRDEAFVLGDTVALMREGRVAQLGTPEDVYGRPADPWCALFVGEANMVEGEADGGTALTPLGRLALAEAREGPVSVVVRPEQLLLGMPAGGGRGARGAIVSAVEYHGPRTHYLVDLEGVVLRVERPGPPVCSTGDRVSLEPVDGRYPVLRR